MSPPHRPLRDYLANRPGGIGEGLLSDPHPDTRARGLRNPGALEKIARDAFHFHTGMLRIMGRNQRPPLCAR